MNFQQQTSRYSRVIFGGLLTREFSRPGQTSKEEGRDSFFPQTTGNVQRQALLIISHAPVNCTAGKMEQGMENISVECLRRAMHPAVSRMIPGTSENETDIQKHWPKKMVAPERSDVFFIPSPNFCFF